MTNNLSGWLKLGLPMTAVSPYSFTLIFSSAVQMPKQLIEYTLPPLHLYRYITNLQNNQLPVGLIA